MLDKKDFIFYEGNQLTVYHRKFPQTESFFLGQESPKEDIMRLPFLKGNIEVETPF